VLHCDDDALALAALGEQPSAADAAHLADCPECRDEVETLRAVIGAVRVPVDAGAPVPPPPRVWNEIVAATGVRVTPRTVTPPAHASAASGAGSPAADPAVPSPPPVAGPPASTQGRRRRPAATPRRALIAVAAAALLVGVIGGALGNSLLRSDPEQQVVTRVVLAALPLDPGAAGQASVLARGDNRQLAVDVSRLGRTTGFYEVWLIDRGVKKMIPLGILHGDRGEFSIPAGVDLGQYPIVDISAEPLDGNPQHSGKSLLRGTIAG
jgi:anti-sigma factor RsiW